MRQTFGFGFLVALLSVASADAQTLTYPDLVARLTDRAFLATLPSPSERVSAVTSYNRRSKYDAAADRYIDWGANDDGGGNAALVKNADGNVVLADLKGPGCIWRVWAANAGKGHVKVLIDGAATPAIDLPFIEWFSGQHAPFDRHNLTYTASSGNDSYIPIPFQHSCKIVAAAGWGEYFQFTYSTFAEGTGVPSFAASLSRDDAAALDAANAALGVPPPPNTLTRGADLQTTVAEIAPGKTASLANETGSGAISWLRVTVENLPNRAEQVAALRELALSIRWDGQSKPAVWSPLGDFFGTAMGANAFQSAMSSMTLDGDRAVGTSSWYMPFASGATIEISNDGPNARKVRVERVRVPLDRPIETLGRFHAKWHRDAFLSPRADRWPDWTILTTQGRGRFCGTMLHVWNPRAGHNPQFGREGDYWWGEGDDKFFVDGERFPSTFGTGTEDYFGYAWANPTPFARPFHGQTLSQNNKGHQSLYRWHISDAVPFQKSFEGDIEKYFPNDWPTRYAAVAYWYLDANGVDPYEPLPIADRVGYFDLSDAYEGERMRIISLTGAGTAKPQELMTDRGSGESIVSGGEQLWWSGGAIGDVLSIAVPVTQDGSYRIKLGTVQAPDYARVEYSLDGTTVLRVDGYHDKLGPVEIDLGEHALVRGESTLAVKIVGINPAAKPGAMASVDYVKLIRER